MSRSGNILFDGVCYNLSAVLQDRCSLQRSGNWPEDSMEKMTFSVVAYPPLKTKSLSSDPFTLKLYEPIIQEEENFEGSGEEVAAFASSLNVNMSSFKPSLLEC